MLVGVIHALVGDYTHVISGIGMFQQKNYAHVGGVIHCTCVGSKLCMCWLGDFASVGWGLCMYWLGNYTHGKYACVGQGLCMFWLGNYAHGGKGLEGVQVVMKNVAFQHVTGADPRWFLI